VPERPADMLPGMPTGLTTIKGDASMVARTKISQSLLLTLSNASGRELDRRHATDGQYAIKVAVLMIVHQDVLSVGDTLKVMASTAPDGVQLRRGRA